MPESDREMKAHTKDSRLGEAPHGLVAFDFMTRFLSFWMKLRLSKLVVLGLLANIVCGAEEKAFPEYELKAALVYQFAKFSTWPTNSFTSPTEPIKIGILGVDPFGPFLKQMVQSRTIGGRKLEIVALREGDDIGACHILFVSGSEKERLTAILAAVDAKPVLTISEIEKFAKAGGAVRLVRVGENVRFELNVQATESAHIQISSTLGAFGIPVRSAPVKR